MNCRQCCKAVGPRTTRSGLCEGCSEDAQANMNEVLAIIQAQAPVQTPGLKCINGHIKKDNTYKGGQCKTCKRMQMKRKALRGASIYY